MPVGICPQCQNRFVIEDERSFQRTCPHCLLPMQVATPAAIPTPLAKREERGSESAGEESDRLSWNDVPLAADERGQRLLRAIAEAAYQGEQAWVRRQEARRLREAARGTAAIPPSVRWAAPSRRAVPDQGARGGAVSAGPGLRAVELCRRAEAARARAREIQIRSRMIRGAVRVMREDRHALCLPEAVLPPLDFVLLSDAISSESLDLESPPFWLAERLTAITTLYVWGYEPPESALCREECRPSEAAGRFAARAGWDPLRPGAWARETVVLQRASAALRELAPTLREDHAVAGWGIRMESVN